MMRISVVVKVNRNEIKRWSFCVDGPDGEREQHRLLFNGIDVLNSLRHTDGARLLAEADLFRIEVMRD